MKEKSKLQYYMELAKEGTRASVEKLLSHLNPELTIAESKFIDYAMGLVVSEAGETVIKEYLFKGTQIQRNYCTLYFGRRGEYLIVRQAYDAGLVDAKQAFSR